MCMVWCEEALIDIAKLRVQNEKLNMEFSFGTVTILPWDDALKDVCISPELLEDVESWELCLSEFFGILKPNEVLYISTANKFCSKQQEFNLPFYSWYPRALKHYFHNLAITTRPGLKGYDKYPAVNWFSYYQLRNEFSKMGMDSFDRFRIMDVDKKPAYKKFIINLIRHNSILRWLGHVVSPELSY